MGFEQGMTSLGQAIRFRIEKENKKRLGIAANQDYSNAIAAAFRGEAPQPQQAPQQSQGNLPTKDQSRLPAQPTNKTGLAAYKWTAGAQRRQPITSGLQGNLQSAVSAVYGPGYSIHTYSGGQPKTIRNKHGVRTSKGTGSTRHDGGNAADSYIIGPNGKRVRGKELAKLGQYWRAKGFGGVGLEMKGGGIHLDSHANRGNNKFWFYGGNSRANGIDAVRNGNKGILPKMYGGTAPTQTAAAQPMQPPTQQPNVTPASALPPQQPMQQPAPQQQPQGMFGNLLSGGNGQAGRGLRANDPAFQFQEGQQGTVMGRGAPQQAPMQQPVQNVGYAPQQAPQQPVQSQPHQAPQQPPQQPPMAPNSQPPQSGGFVPRPAPQMPPMPPKVAQAIANKNVPDVKKNHLIQLMRQRHQQRVAAHNVLEQRRYQEYVYNRRKGDATRGYEERKKIDQKYAAPSQRQIMKDANGVNRYVDSGQQVFEGVQPPKKAPNLATLFDEKTGQQYKAKFNPQTGKFERVGGMKAPTGMSITTNPDGTVSITQGGAKGNPKLTESQSKSLTYYNRAAGALPILDKMGSALTNPKDHVANKLGTVGNYAKSKEYQQANQAGLEFLQAILRKDTGAAITPAETEEYGKVYLPQPGDSAEVLIQKKASRTRALEAIRQGLGPAEVLATARPNTPTQPAPSNPKEMSDNQLLDILRK